MNSLTPWISLPVRLRQVIALLLFVATHLCAQVSTANVSGDVEDASGARIPSVSIKLLNLQTGNENVAATDGAGAFLIPGVLPGLYSMQVQRDGFAAVHLVGLSLSVGESRQFRITLWLSTVEENVDVDASGQSLNTEDAQMTTVVNAHLVNNLPLNGRSFQDLVAMTPGSVSVSPQVPRSSGFSVNGQPPDTNVYWIDGISANLARARWTETSRCRRRDNTPASLRSEQRMAWLRSMPCRSFAWWLRQPQRSTEARPAGSSAC